MNVLAKNSCFSQRRFIRNDIHGVVFNAQDGLAHHAANMIIEQLRAKPDSVLCLPTGRTPLLTYRKLIEAYQRNEVSFRHATIFNVDEYVGLGKQDQGSFATYMRDNLFDHIDCPAARRFIPDGRAENLQQEARDYETRIVEAGGFDLMMLGVGNNGHIGFNEPGSEATSRTRLVKLAPQTLQANAADLPQEKRPTEALSIGMQTIMEARRIVLLAMGELKRPALEHLFARLHPEQWPVSLLADHPNFTVLMDEQALPFNVR